MNAASRDAIFERIRTITSAMPEKSPLPEYDPALTHSANRLAGDELTAVFERNLSVVNGKLMTSVDALADFLKTGNQTHGYCDPALYDTVGKALSDAGLTVEAHYDRDHYEQYLFGVTRATGAIAESGTIILDDEHTSHRLAALSPWVHVAVLAKETIHRTISDALAAMGDSPNVVWCTGPSKTADVEGILIEGVHGPGEQIALLV